jgi:hypothetical protein
MASTDHRIDRSSHRPIIASTDHRIDRSPASSDFAASTAARIDAIDASMR